MKVKNRTANGMKKLISAFVGAMTPMLLLILSTTNAYAGVFTPPTANFSYTQNKTTVSFTDTSTDSETSVSEWYWDLGDGNHKTMVKNFDHTYKYPGTYTVKLEVVDTTGLRDDVTKQIVVTGDGPFAPVANFSYSGTEPVTFTDTSTDADDEIVEWYWDLGDGSHETMKKSFSHSYYYGGIYNVTLEVVDVMGHRNSTTRQVAATGKVKSAPVANFTATVNQNTVTFTDTSTDSDNKVVEWYWDLGDGNHKTGVKTFSHTYRYAGIYTVSLEVVDESGLRNTKQKQVTATGAQIENPTADFDYSSGDSVTYGFFDRSTTGNGSIVEWYWDFGDGTHKSMVSEAVHAYTRGGTYTVKLEVVDEMGKRDTVEKSIQVTGPAVYDPYVYFSKQITTGNNTVLFTDESISFNGSITERYWDMGDGTHVQMQSNVSHTYAYSGIYTVKLMVVDDYGATGTYEETIWVIGESKGSPNALFTYYNDWISPDFTFYDISTSPNGPIVEWYWDLGDGTLVSNKRIVEHTYQEAGIYTIKLEVVDINGQRDTYEKTLLLPFHLFD